MNRPLPPEIFLYLRSTGSQEVIEIHHGVDTSIEKCQKTTVTASDKSKKLIRKHSQPAISKLFPLCTKPTLEWHDSVVIDVQEGKVGEFLLQDEEEGVKHVKEFGDVEDPGKIQSPHGFWIIGVVDRFTGPAVASTDVESGKRNLKTFLKKKISFLLPSLMKSPQTEQCLE